MTTALTSSTFPKHPTMNGLLLQCPIEVLGDAIGQGLSNEKEARGETPEFDLVGEVVGGVLCVVIHA
jgi:hypothetical protein